ncbi:uncharacterized protein JN550_005989 [Neoarthrinium moseri]|uniref:uncharacterized protein n=1 Tax=Neoarthrinium moseri TaxID=1658444 RepID=UPI001FDC7B3C|nr:uncharacterized protein JN550_005989 [Neoarthrinium moseri]KAI1869359.1 hypothetical protein JN550_005989 [Neoarthrinium moseri]
MEATTLEQVYRLLTSADASLTYKPFREERSPSVASPHSCLHCGKVLVNGDIFREKPLVHFGDDRYSRDTSPSLKVSYGLDEAIAASREGCKLYEWFLDTLSIEILSVHSLAFPIDRIEFHLAFETDGKIDCSPIIEAVGRDGERRRLVNKGLVGVPWSRLSICAPRDDPASSIIPHRPAETDVFSTRSIEFARDCLSTCMKHHEQCRTDWLKADLHRVAQDRHPLEDIALDNETIALEDLPTRLLKINKVLEPGKLMVSLITVEDLSISEQSQVAADGFAALSYCWGREGNPVQLTAKTLEELQSGIVTSSLPSTINDAIHFAHDLGLKYIWVDALCIFQDSTQDKELEITRMGSYYGTNTVTLCAASAPGSSNGLRSTEPAPSLYRVPPLVLRCDVGGAGRILLHSSLDLREPITGRGWTLQESLLSRRLVIFSHQLYWCCATANAACEGELATLPRVPNRNFGAPASLVPGVYPAQVLRDYPPEVQWYLVVGDFARRRLGVEADKLLAVSAFAGRVHARFRACGGPRDDGTARAHRSPGASIAYVAGLLLSRRDLSLVTPQLFWQVARTADCTRPKAYRAPSWSWASVDGELKLGESERGSHTVTGFDVTLTNANAPYGSVQQAAIRMSGCHMPSLQESLGFGVQIVDAADLPSERGVRILADTPPDAELIQSAITESKSPVFLLHLSGDVTRPGREIPYGCVGLVVMPAPGAVPNTYQRLGTFNFYRSLQDYQIETSEGAKTLFDVPRQDVALW